MRYLNTDKKPKVIIKLAVAYKMRALVEQSSKEIGWHFLIDRDKETNTYTVYDIVLFPQYVTAATVTPDADEYANWLDELYEMIPDKFKDLRGHGHSHVNMGTGPSGTDTTYRENIIDGLSNDDYYLFIIMNKRDEYSIELYDMEKQVCFESNDVELVFEDFKEIVNWQMWSMRMINENVKEEHSTCSTTANQQKYSTHKNKKKK